MSNHCVSLHTTLHFSMDRLKGCTYYGFYRDYFANCLYGAVVKTVLLEVSDPIPGPDYVFIWSTNVYFGVWVFLCIYKKKYICVWVINDNKSQILLKISISKNKKKLIDRQDNVCNQNLSKSGQLPTPYSLIFLNSILNQMIVLRNNRRSTNPCINKSNWTYCYCFCKCFSTIAFNGTWKL